MNVNMNKRVIRTLCMEMVGSHIKEEIKLLMTQIRVKMSNKETTTLREGVNIATLEKFGCTRGKASGLRRLWLVYNHTKFILDAYGIC